MWVENINNHIDNPVENKPEQNKNQEQEKKLKEQVWTLLKKIKPTENSELKDSINKFLTSELEKPKNSDLHNKKKVAFEKFLKDFL